MELIDWERIKMWLGIRVKAANHKKHWAETDVKLMINMTAGDYSDKSIAKRLGRTIGAIQQKRMDLK